LFAVLGSLSLGSLLTGMGETKTLMNTNHKLGKRNL
jgi:hypothetical protein